MPTLDRDTLALGLAWYVVFVFSTVLHEASHALVAHLGGDDTAAQGGQVGLDPLPHMQREPVGMLLVPWVSYLLNHWMMGWASAPYDPMWADRYPKRAARMAVAGPVANFFLAVLAGITIRVGVSHGWLAIPDTMWLDRVAVAPTGEPSALSMLISIAFSLNLLLGTFNLLPFPPLDGSGAVGLLLPEETARRWQATIHNPQWLMLGMVVAYLLFSKVGGYVFHWGLQLLYWGTGAI